MASPEALENGKDQRWMHQILGAVAWGLFFVLADACRFRLPKFLIPIVAIVAVHTASADEIQTGTLALLGDKVVFVSGGIRNEYAISEVTGLKMVSYQNKVQSREGREVDVSELTISTAPGQTVVLVQSKPVRVKRTMSGAGWRWEIE